MLQIKAQKLSREACEKYGTYQDLLNDEELRNRSVFPHTFFADLFTLEMGGNTLPTVSVCNPCRSCEGMIYRSLEAHECTSEGLLPIDDDIVIIAGKPGVPGEQSRFPAENIEAFIVPQGTFVKLNPYISHAGQYPVHKDSAHVLCLLPARTFNNDMLLFTLDEEEAIKVVF